MFAPNDGVLPKSASITPLYIPHALKYLSSGVTSAWVDWCFYKAYGIATAKSLIGGNFDDYTVESANMYKKHGAYYKSNPKIGDQIFFNNGKRICHTGIVLRVDSKRVYTSEGNTSSESGVVSNGGRVAEKSYPLNYKYIDGYGRPKYDIVPMPTPSPTIPSQVYTKEQFRQDVFAILKVNNIEDAIKKSVTIASVTLAYTVNEIPSVTEAIGIAPIGIITLATIGYTVKFVKTLSKILGVETRTE